MKFTLRQLQVFVFTAKYQNISIAADNIAITQAAASMSLSQLETQLGKKLFARDGKRLLLNEIGQRLLPDAHAILQKANEFELQANNDKPSIAGHIRISASTTIACYLLPKILSQFTKEHPEISFELFAHNTENCIKKILNLDADLALVEGMSLQQNIDYQPWMTDTLTVFCHPKHPLAKQKNVSNKQLTNYPWLLREKASGTRQIVEQWLNPISPKIKQFTLINNSLAIKNYIKTNKLALSCLSQAIISDDLVSGSLVSLAINTSQLTRHFYIAQYKATTISKAAALLLTFLSKYDSKS